MNALTEAAADFRVFAGSAPEEGRMLGKCLAWRIWQAGRQTLAYPADKLSLLYTPSAPLECLLAWNPSQDAVK